MIIPSPAFDIHQLRYGAIKRSAAKKQTRIRSILMLSL